MVWNKQKITRLGTMVLMAVVMTACSISYQFNGSSIDYTKVKSIAIESFPNRSVGFVWGPMESMFNTALQDIYTQQTRLQMVKRGGDLTLSGEITNYDAYNKGVWGRWLFYHGRASYDRPCDLYEQFQSAGKLRVPTVFCQS